MSNRILVRILKQIISRDLTVAGGLVVWGNISEILLVFVSWEGDGSYNSRYDVDIQVERRVEPAASVLSY